ncbi:hypothetical protein PAXINDRAFT_20262 [Paxillus involutus ATCC 200175]|uniref:Amino acid permease/ SLC12A domain-containing protein n=1 Tax=Paxillus involutus ATCC 200175 TaxID=664439 RepID=A0A0C9TGZ5_PAXIN|nr:hypothetical protein PAXINDRAFT_20262 [Paxillus involutus ATCC 200175]
MSDEAQAGEHPRFGTFTAYDEAAPRRLLKQRHVQMQVSSYHILRSLTIPLTHRIAIAGTLGTGLFLGSGAALGALIAYALVSTVAFASLCSVGEMTSFAPVRGTFPHYASRWVDPALGFAVGWNYFYTMAIAIPVEISGAQLLIGYWDSKPDHQWIYIASMCLSACIINVFGVRWFGEAEFMFSFMKLTMITILVLVGLVINLGGAPDHERLGFRYWKDPGPFSRAGLVSNLNLDRFLGFLSVIVQAGFSFQGMEIAAIAAAVTESPRRNVSKAIRKTLYRVLIFYIVGILIAGMIVPSNDPDLLEPFSDSNQGSVTESPFIIAMKHAGIKAVTGVVNAGFVTSAFSAANSFLFAASRVLEALACRGQGPAIFRETYHDTPIAAVLFTFAFGLLSSMSLGQGAGTAFRWFVDLTTVGGFLTWGTINLTYIYFYRGLKYHNIDRQDFVYWSAFQPWLSIWGLVMCIFFVLVNGFQVFWHFKREESDFFASYINIPLFFCLYAYWKIAKKTSVRTVQDRDYTTGIPSIEETETVPNRLHGFWQRLAHVLF